MRRSANTFATASVIVIGLAAAPFLYAYASQGGAGPMQMPGMTSPGMMGPGTMGPDMMGQGSMMGMMNMMGQMSQMMEHCAQMMQGMTGGAGAPNEQWRTDPPATPQKNG